MMIEVINGLLGSGKTTYLLNLLNQKDSREKIAVLVNEFGEIGIDGDIIGGHGANVVELPNGCICCSLNADLRNQIRIIAETYRPDRLYIEPTGIATIKNLMSILGALSLEKYIEGINTVLIVDAGAISDIIQQNYGFVETQIKMADVIVINKCDKATADQLESIMGIIKGINQSGQIMLTSYGRILDRVSEGGVTSSTSKIPPMLEPHDGKNGNGHYHELPIKKYEQFSASSEKTFDFDKVKNLFRESQEGKFGSVERAKGIFKGTGESWLRVDIASGDVNEALLNTAFGRSKLIVIGTGLDREKLKSEFEKCKI